MNRVSIFGVECTGYCQMGNAMKYSVKTGSEESCCDPNVIKLLKGFAALGHSSIESRSWEITNASFNRICHNWGRDYIVMLMVWTGQTITTQ